MNKKLFLGMFAAAGMLLATSCSNDELDVVQSGNEAQVTFSLDLEGGIATRAISDGTGADRLVYAVFDEDGARISTIAAVDKETTFPATETLTLAKGQTYQVAFWAQDSECDAYTVNTDKMEVSVKYTDGTDGSTSDANNDETRDAFFKTIKFTVNGSTSLDVELKRPFAQINVGVTEADWNAAVASGITIEKSSVVIKNAATSINLLTGAVGAASTDVVVTYAANAIPNETLYVETNAQKEGKEAYKWLSMSYILVGDHDATVDDNGLLGTDKTTLEGLKFTFTPKTGSPIAFEEGLANAPVRRNWRTNILGKILTGDVQFNITIDPAYNGDYIYPDGTIEQELEFAATFGGKVTLSEDVTLTTPLAVTADMILDLNGKTIKGEGLSDRGVIEVTNNATVTIKGDGTVITSSAYPVLVDGGTLNLEGGSYTATNSTQAVYVRKGVANISGGYYNVDSKYNSTSYVDGNGNGKYVLNCLDTDYKNGTAKIVVTGGTFCKFDPANNVAESANTNFVADGYKTLQDGDNYVVVADNIDAVAADATELNDALKAGENVVMVEDVTIETTTESNGYANTGIYVKDGQVFDGNGNTLSVPGATKTWASAIATTGGTIKNVTITAGFRGIFMPGATTDVYIDNVVIGGDGLVYTFNSDAGNKNYGVYISNSTLNGWTSHSDVHKEVVYTNCYFGEGSGYAFCRPYGPTSFVGCAFEAGFEVDARGKITFENCTIGGVALTAENLATLVTSNTVNATVK